jgi:hypothetical protein
MDRIFPKFWIWIIKGFDGSIPGYKYIINKYLVIHLFIGVILSIFIDTPIQQVSEKIIIPLTGILIGLTFSLIGNAQGFLQTEEIIQLSKNVKGGYIVYILNYQLSIFIILITSGIWFLLSIDIACPFNFIIWPIFFESPIIIKIFKGIFFYSLISISIRESWSVIQSIYYLLIAKNKIYEKNKKDKET